MCILGSIRITKGEKWMVRRLVLILTAAVLLMGTGLPTQAAQARGTIRLCLNYGAERSEPGTVMLFKAAQCVGQDYKLEEHYGGGLIKGEDIHAPELASWLAERTGEDGTRRMLDADGAADFSHLEEGLYLAVQTETPEGFLSFSPFLIPMPYDGQWEIQANPKTGQIMTESPRTGEHPSPLLGAMGLVLSGMALAVCAEKLRKK